MSDALLWLILLLPGDEFAAGVRAYQEGRFEQALAAFGEAEKAAGEDASPELLFNKALSALQAGKLAVAESSAEQAAARGGPEFAARRDFVRGNVAFARCAQAELAASMPQAEPFAFDSAIVHAETARGAWQLAAVSRPDWPEARRNLERAVKKIEELKQKKAAAEQNKKKNESQPDSPPQPPQRPPEERERPQQSEPKQEPARIEPATVELSAEQVKQLLDTLAQKEREKRKLRSDQRRLQKIEVERDW